MSAVGGIEREMSGRCVGSEFALAGVHDVDGIPLADAEVFGNVCNDVASDIAKLILGIIFDVVDFVFELAEDTLITIVFVAAAARLAILEEVLAKLRCIELCCELAIC